MEFFESDIFKQAAKQVAFRMEKAAERNVEIFGKTWYQNHFSVNPTPHTVDTFDAILGNTTMPIAASTINGNSAEPMRQLDGFGSITQKMYTHAHAYRLDSSELREMLIMTKTLPEKQVLEYITNKLMNINTRSVDGVRARVDLIILTALYMNGKFTFTDENDPGSPFIGQTLEFGFDPTHAVTVGSGNTWVAGNEDTVDPFKEIQDVVDHSPVAFERILINKQDLNYILKCKSMKNYINTVQTVNAPLTAAKLNQFMSDNGLPSFEVVQRRVRVQGADFSTSELTPFGAGKLVFLPSNKIGTIETRLSDAELGLKSPEVEYSYYGRIELARYKMGEKQNTQYTEITKARMTAAPVFDSIKDMYSLDVTK